MRARKKQIEQEPLRGSRDLFVPRYDSFPMNPEKKDTNSLIDMGLQILVQQTHYTTMSFLALNIS